VKQFLQFIMNHWILWSAFVLIIIIILFEEIRGRVQGVSRLQPQDLTLLINREDATVIDVRDSNAFIKGHIIGAINIPHTRMKDSMEKLKKYQDKPVVLVCATGQTSPQEGAKLQKNGFEKVYFLSGGIAAWQGAGLPLIRG
jgi:rhodanese-related sulfurtransferase